MLDLDPNRPEVAPRDAATLVLVRDGVRGLEVFCVERHKDSTFLGGAIVFPGGKVDPSDRDPGWAPLTTPPRAASFGADQEALRALAIAGCRETLEEGAILPAVDAAFEHHELLGLRKQLVDGTDTLRAFLARRGAKLDLAALHPLARWITPVSESRRFDTRFFVAVAGPAEKGAHDDHETTASFWAAPADVLARFDAGNLQLLPPTHRTLTLLTGLARAQDAVDLAAASCLDPICPRLVPQRAAPEDTVALVLPGDREHDLTVHRVPGPSRYVLRGTRWLAEEAP